MKVDVKHLCILGIFAVSEAFASGGVFYSGNTLYSALKDYRSANTTNNTAASAGAGFVIGIADLMDDTKDSRTNFKFCIPENSTKGQLIDVVFAHLEKYPEKRHLTAWSLVEKALQEAFPCN